AQTTASSTYRATQRDRGGMDGRMMPRKCLRQRFSGARGQHQLPREAPITDEQVDTNTGRPAIPAIKEALAEPVTLAVVVGLVVGKPLGIASFNFAAVRCGLAKLPERVSWGALTAGGALAGVGFTMSLSIAGLALSERLPDAAKVGILAASAL